MASGPLDGVRVLEFTQIIAGPLGGMLLSDMGAEVTKVEPIEGEPWRLQAQFIPLESKGYQSFNRGKRSLAMDLTSPASQEAIHRLVRDMDVVVVNYRPDVSERLKIDYPTLSRVRPDLVYMDSTAFGRRGPQALRPGYDIIAQAASGLAASGGRIDERGNPTLPGGTATADFATAYAIAWGVCAALFHRERTGRGQLVETSLLANGLMFQNTRFMSLPAADAVTRAASIERLHDARARGRSYAETIKDRREELRGRMAGYIYYRCYNTRDGAIAVGCLSLALREKMRQALGVDDIRDRPGYDPGDPQALEFGRKLTEQVEAMIASQSTEHWVTLLEQAGVPVSPLNFVEELDEHPQVIANGYTVELEHDLAGWQRMVAPPIKMSESPPQAQGASPPLGRDTNQILGEIGYAAEEIEDMRRAGTIR